MKKNNFVVVLVLLFAQFSFAQTVPRQILKGKISSDSTEVENITVFNLSSNIGAITDVDGEFSIQARVKDTLYFQGLSFVSQVYVLNEKDFWIEELEIRLEVKVNELNEVELS